MESASIAEKIALEKANIRYIVESCPRGLPEDRKELFKLSKMSFHTAISQNELIQQRLKLFSMQKSNSLILINDNIESCTHSIYDNPTFNSSAKQNNSTTLNEEQNSVVIQAMQNVDQYIWKLNNNPFSEEEKSSIDESKEIQLKRKEMPFVQSGKKELGSSGVASGSSILKTPLIDQTYQKQHREFRLVYLMLAEYLLQHEYKYGKRGRFSNASGFVKATIHSAVGGSMQKGGTGDYSSFVFAGDCLSLQPNLAELAALILWLFDQKDLPSSFVVFWYLADICFEYNNQSEFSLIRSQHEESIGKNESGLQRLNSMSNDTIILASRIVTGRLSNLARHFNSLKFDILDLHSLALNQTRTFFVGIEFGPEFSTEILTLILKFGEIVLIATVYIILSTLEPHLMKLQSCSQTLDFLIEIVPVYLTLEDHIEFIIDNVYDILAQWNVPARRSNAINKEDNQKPKVSYYDLWNYWVLEKDREKDFRPNFTKDGDEKCNLQFNLNLVRFIKENFRNKKFNKPFYSQLNAQNYNTMKATKPIPHTERQKSSSVLVTNKSHQNKSHFEKDEEPKLNDDDDEEENLFRLPDYFHSFSYSNTIGSTGFSFTGDDLDLARDNQRLNKELLDKSRQLSELELEIRELRRVSISSFNKGSTLSVNSSNNTTSITGTLDSIGVSNIKAIDDRSKNSNVNRKEVQTQKFLPETLIGNEIVMSYGNFPLIQSDSISTLTMPCTFMNGWLLKISKPTKILQKRSIERRQFVLKGSYLTYFKSNLHARPQKDKCLDIRMTRVRSIDNHRKGRQAIELSLLNNSSTSNLSEQQSEAKSSTNTSKISDSKTKNEKKPLQYILFATNSEQRDQWIQAFNNVS